jgi:hypothetical protein
MQVVAAAATLVPQTGRMPMSTLLESGILGASEEFGDGEVVCSSNQQGAVRSSWDLRSGRLGICAVQQIPPRGRVTPQAPFKRLL